MNVSTIIAISFLYILLIFSFTSLNDRIGALESQQICRFDLNKDDVSRLKAVKEELVDIHLDD